MLLRIVRVFCDSLERKSWLQFEAEKVTHFECYEIGFQSS